MGGGTTCRCSFAHGLFKHKAAYEAGITSFSVAGVKRKYNYGLHWKPTNLCIVAKLNCVLHSHQVSHLIPEDVIRHYVL